jgi:hypothetical protein
LLAFAEELAGGTWIRVVDGKLQHKGVFGKANDLFPVGKNLFRGQKEPEATAVFFPDQSGRMIYVGTNVDSQPYGERISPLWPYTRLALLIASGVLMASAPLFALVWVLLWLFRRLKGVKHLRVRALPVLAVLCFLAVPFAFGKAFGQIGESIFWPVVVFIGTVLFPVLSLASLALAVSVPKEEIHKGVRIHSLLVSLACCIVTVFISAWHMIGLRLWAA